jgi:hypothetical protein
MWPNKTRDRGEGADFIAGQWLIMENCPHPHHLSIIADPFPSKLKMIAACAS